MKDNRKQKQLMLFGIGLRRSMLMSALRVFINGQFKEIFDTTFVRYTKSYQKYQLLFLFSRKKFLNFFFKSILLRYLLTFFSIIKCL